MYCYNATCCYHLGYLYAKNYQIWWRFDEVLTKTSWVILWAHPVLGADDMNILTLYTISLLSNSVELSELISDLAVTKISHQSNYFNYVIY